MNKKYYYIELDNYGFNQKTAYIPKRFFPNNYIPIYFGGKKNAKQINDILDKYNEINNVILLYYHRNMGILTRTILNYLNNNIVNFKFYLFTFDFWHQNIKDKFEPENYKIIANGVLNIEHLDFFLKSDHSKWKDNYIFMNFWCCYNESLLDFNDNPTKKLLISGASGRCYPERHKLKYYTENQYIYFIERSNERLDIKSNEFIYNKRLNSFFACFSSSVYQTRCGNTHCLLLKTFEILGAGSLLVMPLVEEKYILEIGLVNMENCYLIDFSKNINPQIDYIFDNIDLFDKIRKNGHEHAKKNLNENIMISKLKNIIES